MKVCVLGSGSKGNCTLVESGENRVLIDAGFSGKEIEKRLALVGRRAESLKAILVTHEHNDHVAGAGVLSRRYQIPVYINHDTFEAALKKLGKVKRVRSFTTGEAFGVGDLTVHPFAVSHDTADPVGFVLGNGGCSVGYCTDTGRLTRLMSHHLSRCSALVLESNHDPHLLRTGPYPLPLQQRISSSTGHLSNKEAMDFAAELAENNLQQLIFAHLSETNNDLELVMKQAQEKLQKHRNLEVHFARQHVPTPLISVE